MSVTAQAATLIYNPAAGFGDWEETVNGVAEFWREQGWEITLRPTERAEHAIELAREAADAGTGLVLAAGGDGTLNEVANGLAGSDTILGLLPAGTANSFAKELGMPQPSRFNLEWLQETSGNLLGGRVHRMDIGRCEDGRTWLLWAGTGVDGFVVDQVEPRTPLFKRLGPVGYFFKAVAALPEFPGMRATVTVDDQQVEGEFVLITAINCRMFAGGELLLNENGVLDDGNIEVWCFRGADWPEIMRYTIEVGLQAHEDDPNIEVLSGRSVTIETDPPMPYHLDGEPAGKTPVRCSIDAGALRLLVPDTAPDGLFQGKGQALSEIFGPVQIETK